MPLTFAEDTASALPLHVVEAGALEGWAGAQGGTVQTWVKATGFSGGIGEVLLVPDANGAPFLAVAGYGTAAQRARGRFALAAVAEKLPDGVYRLDGDLSAVALEEEALGWLLTGYGFDRYRAQKVSGARLVAPEGVDARRVEIIAAGEALTRDLINTPASDMGPQELEDVARGLATEFGASFDVIEGDDLLSRNFPMIHAVGRASPRAPRLIDMAWGESGPTLIIFRVAARQSVLYPRTTL